VPWIQTTEIPVKKKSIYTILDSSIAWFHKWNLPWWMEFSANSVRPEADMRELVVFDKRLSCKMIYFELAKPP
jgi:hypothetical protein